MLNPEALNQLAKRDGQTSIKSYFKSEGSRKKLGDVIGQPKTSDTLDRLETEAKAKAEEKVRLEAEAEAKALAEAEENARLEAEAKAQAACLVLPAHRGDSDAGGHPAGVILF